MSRRVKRSGEIIVNRRQPKDDSTLFPGFRLQTPVRSAKQVSVISGTTFEKLSERLLGGGVRTTSSAADVCPDAINDEKKLLIESKSCQRQHAFKVYIPQLDNYEDVRRQWWAGGHHYQVTYCLWAYNAKSLSIPVDVQVNGHVETRHRTMEEVVRTITEATTHVDVLALNILLRLRELCENEATRPQTCSVKTYPSWTGYNDDADYHVLNVGHAWLKRLRGNVPTMLLELDLNPNEYRWGLHTREGDAVVVDGMRFPLPPVNVLEVVRPVDWQEYADDELYDDEVPF